jgi:pimeloyl-ACP methyl ester carboxylesterase
VLVMAGELDPVCPLADAEDIVDALPAMSRQFERFAGCGHGARHDDAAAAMVVLRRFIVTPPEHAYNRALSKRRNSSVGRAAHS